MRALELSDPRPALERLAEAWGVAVAYRDLEGRLRRARPEVLLAALRALGAPVAREKDVQAALEERERDIGSRLLEPVVVAWEGEPAQFVVRLPAAQPKGRLGLRVVFEQGGQWSASLPLDVLEPAGAARVDGRARVALRCRLGADWPTGYHRLEIGWGRCEGRAHLFCAPKRAWGARGEGPERAWGVFVPLYALSRSRSWGSGDYTVLAELACWLAAQGGTFLATLPLLPLFLEEPCEPSPYVPVSRLMWNEFYVDIPALPEVRDLPAAVQGSGPPAWRRRATSLRAGPLVDYRAIWRLKREAFGALAGAVAASPGWSAALRGFLSERPLVVQYARFRAALECRGAPWARWPERWRSGALRAGEVPQERERAYAYAQWAATRQLQEAVARARRAGAALALDLPLGCHPSGFDTWSEPQAFVPGIHAGAPPDPFFRRGQDWSFAPLHPQRTREDGHAYFRRCLAHQMGPASLLRLDHVMALHRLYWIPEGFAASDGVYVRYPAEELYAVVAIESRRQGCLVVGEDLGTVPRELRPMMRRHGLSRMYVLQFSASPGRPLRVPAACVASWNTHDMPPFAAFWAAQDIPQALAAGRIDARRAEAEQRRREAVRRWLVRELRRCGALPAGRTPRLVEVFEASLEALGASPARVVQVQLEDLWFERRPQNVPGTTDGAANWRRRARYDLERVRRSPTVRRRLGRLRRARRGTGGKGG